MSVIKIKHGITFKGKISNLGIILIIISLFIIIKPYYNGEDFSILTILGLILLLFGILFFLSIRGVLIDKKYNSIKSYLFIIVKIGKWQSLSDYYEIKLKYINMAQSLGLRGAATNLHTESYDIVLISETKKSLILKECIDYEKAKSFLYAYSKILNKPYHDEFEEIEQKILERKQYVRR